MASFAPSKKRCSSPLNSPDSPHRKHKRFSPSSPDSGGELDSGLETFIADDSSVDIISCKSPEKHTNLEGLEEFLFAEDDFSDETPVVIDMACREGKSSDYSSSSSASKENHVKRAVEGKRGHVASGESLIRFSDQCTTSKCSLLSKDDTFRIRECFKRSSGTLHERENCPFSDKSTWSGYRRDHELFDHHPTLEPLMRSMLMEWMMEVSRAHNLQRKTYHTALDFVDRFLSFTENLPKSVLQLLGISALTIAAKIEEIFPPKISEMAYVTDDAHDEDDIKGMEKLIISVLGTALMPVTPSEWIGIFLHEAGATGHPKRHSRALKSNKLSVENQLPLELYSRICRLVDLSVLDHVSMEFSYRQISAAAILISDCDNKVMRYVKDQCAPEMDTIKRCIEWMTVYADVERSLPPVRLCCPAKMPQVQWPHLQSHEINMDIFMHASEMQKARPLTERNRNLDVSVVNFEEDEDSGIHVVCSSSTPQRPAKKPVNPPSTVFCTPPDSQTKRRPRK